jgi:single-stranded-DNA-specific exonuclease
MEDARIALDLLMTKDNDEAYALAHRLHDLNARRQEDQKQIFEEAMEQAMQQTEARCLVLSGTGWSGTIIGNVASKIVEQLHRPCVMIALDAATGAGRGSARSIHAFNIYDAINACGSLLDEYGGHAHAAGLSIGGDKVADFTAQMNRLAGQLLSDEDLQPSLDVAMEVDPSEVTADLLCQFEAFAPFGNGNQAPMLVSRGVSVLEVARMGKDKDHLRLNLRAEGLNGKGVVSAPWFYRGDFADALESVPSLDICYKPQFNDWNGQRSIQFVIEDIQPPEW